MDNHSFIEQYKTKPIPEIALLLSKHPDLDKEFIINQINGLQKAKSKLPEFYQNPNIVFPPTISIEQCSSQHTAGFKANILEGKTLVDLTGGFGIDSYYFSKIVKSVTYLEPYQPLFEVVTQNFKTLAANNIICLNTNAEDFLNNNTTKFDVAYIDPSRRNDHQKVFLLSNCSPNVVELKTQILEQASALLIKTSPILDIKQSIKELGTVKTIWVVSVNNECKEVLYLVTKNAENPLQLHAINIPILKGVRGVLQKFSFTYEEEEENTLVEFSEPLKYLYEPNASLLKAGAFKSIAAKYKLKKIAPNSHLYTANECIANFPGRSFSITNVLPYQPKAFKKLKISKANIACRNFNETVDQIKKKLKLNDGGAVYIFATTNANNKNILIVTNKA